MRCVWLLSALIVTVSVCADESPRLQKGDVHGIKISLSEPEPHRHGDLHMLDADEHQQDSLGETDSDHTPQTPPNKQMLAKVVSQTHESAADMRKELKLKEAALAETVDDSAHQKPEAAQVQPLIDEKAADVGEAKTTKNEDPLDKARNDAQKFLHSIGDSAPEVEDTSDATSDDAIGESKGKMDEPKEVPMATKAEADNFLKYLGITDDDVNA